MTKHAYGYLKEKEELCFSILLKIIFRTIFPRTSKFVIAGAKLSTSFFKQLEINRITALNRKTFAYNYSSFYFCHLPILIDLSFFHQMFEMISNSIIISNHPI